MGKTNVIKKIETTDVYKNINKNEPTDFEAIIIDGIECLKERTIAMFSTWEQVDFFMDCLVNTEDLEIEQFGKWFGCYYYELNNKARKELERARA